eukprot:1846192-Prymnesium_polylepis.1
MAAFPDCGLTYWDLESSFGHICTQVSTHRTAHSRLALEGTDRSIGACVTDRRVHFLLLNHLVSFELGRRLHSCTPEHTCRCAQ